jgi:hypothetical protein
MTSIVNQGIGPAGSYIEMFWNGPLYFTGQFWTWYRSLNTQEWLGPFPLADQAIYTTNERYTRWFVDTSQITDFNRQHRNGFYQVVVTPAFGPTDKPTLGPINLGMVRLLFNNGGEMDTEPYISNNEQREADTYFRPNYT